MVGKERRRQKKADEEIGGSVKVSKASADAGKRQRRLWAGGKRKTHHHGRRHVNIHHRLEIRNVEVFHRDRFAGDAGVLQQHDADAMRCHGMAKGSGVRDVRWRGYEVGEGGTNVQRSRACGSDPIDRERTKDDRGVWKGVEA